MLVIGEKINATMKIVSEVTKYIEIVSFLHHWLKPKPKQISLGKSRQKEMI